MLDIVKSAFIKLRKKFNKGYEFYLTFYLVINVIWIFLGMFLYNYFRFSYYSFSTSYVMFFLFNFLIILFLNLIKKIKFDKIDIFLILLVLFVIIATVFAKDINVSLYGWWRRYEGFFQLLYYYSLMYLASIILGDKNKMKIIGFIILFGLFNSFVSVLQIFDILKFIPINCRGCTFAQGLIGNSNFLGSYMVLCLGLSVGLFLYNHNNKTFNVIFLILCLCFYTGLLCSSTLSGMVGLFFIFLCVFFYFLFLLKKKKINKSLIIKHIVLIVCLILLNVLLNSTGKIVMNNDVKKLTFEATEIAKGNFDNKYGSGRMFIWKKTISVIPNHLLHGVGVDSFAYAFGDYMLSSVNSNALFMYDKAHNEYLQKLVCEGLLSCLTYIGMLFVIFITSLKNILSKNNYIVIGLFFAFIGYSIQAFFNISVIEVAPLFWIVCGLLYNRKCRE